MTYELEFSEKAWKEWQKLRATVRELFKKKLQEHLGNPHVPGDRLSGFANAYKIKLRTAGYRLVYKVVDEVLVVTVIAVGKRERGDVYSDAKRR
ncbi:type II toxin-antitoxin system RelE/ParE family toxin [Pseudomonas gingeri NCPPB 3146 = LMG 5327]|uniref:Type II toxin-antitoxin system RelE/ParE family toxin n=2 Tax=Pseudomonas gingeri TaxID=117681 RepID=A0A7Y7XUC1_9PSED|nr:type II toxin-antitoxin system RelE/ParE family toxin [Pseudomonas gingeri]NVZ64736.1 type II toxin-antitoxin system RelE/ParE family toxin [Pseudomonas gingeri]NVZ78199.1 type II toxin-antitoxin system RelE/ParE family toxin [Pseudomonas gingeri]NWA09017.1 type II toxin-antitoxin system RelE/ParE family toxin [Pseudomonas gingeri]NWC12483.1 type II toxin-antitoxin system RelE/ParE family toxin [Pseudomonas gingeri]PNQ93378.1 type II toxin-antitoxin system RelE/ParE family toxin [Pseudomona